MILLRLAHGITDHFPVRKTEWVMAYWATGSTFCLLNQQSMFDLSPTYVKLSQIADEPIWAAFLFVVVLLRLGALIVNGTFENFTHSPLLRFIASLAGVFFWSQYCLGLTSAAIYSGGVWAPVVAFSTAVILEILNTKQSLEDMLEAYAKKRMFSNGGMAPRDNP